MRTIIILLSAATALGACATTETTDPNNPRLVARASDSALHNTDTLSERGFGIAVTPDGCQQWIGDNGIEGYADTRWDPRSGLPVCSNSLPPGALIGPWKQTNLPDFLP